MAVVSMVVGATTDDGATFVAKVDGGGPVRVAVADNAGMTSPTFTSSQAVDAQGVAKVAITGLAADAAYWWQVEDNSTLDTTVTGRFRTHPTVGLPASFTIAASACAGLVPDFPGVDGGELAQSRVSNHPVFDTIRELEPLMFVHLGDLHYYDLGSGSHGITGGGSLANYRTAYDDVLTQPRQHQLYREVAWVYVWDDHDYGPNNSDGTFVDKANAQQVYRERVPHYPLDDSDAIFQSWQIGRVLFVASDTRSDRSPNTDPDDASKTMLGAAQKAWLDNLLETSTAQVLVWIMPSQWMGISSDSWDVFQTERDELVAMLSEHGWLGRMCMVYADHHAVGISSGASNPWGGFPVLEAGSLDSAADSNPVHDAFDILTDTVGRNQYGTLQITDLGSAITIRLNAYQGTELLGTYAFGVALPPEGPPPELNRLLHGSHRPVVEARVLTTFQTGEDPDGTEIPVLGGDVQFDATAEVFATLGLDTEGHDGRRSLFPRRASDLLAPYGNEVFVRRGVDIGPSVVWVPLGYFRLDAAGQSQTSDHPVRLAGQDRMAGIVDGWLVQPLFFAATRTFASVITELVQDIYPDAVLLSDDDSIHAPIGRDLIVERDRHEALRDLADSLGKVVFWDGLGFLRVQDPPDPEDIVWEIKAGRHGVLVDSGREVSREGMYNAVVAKGEGVTGDAVRAVVVDDGPTSPTRWGGRFGKVPREYSSPLLTTGQQARMAARSLLRRYIGVPYSVNFGAVPNPALRPREAVRITQKDGTRERHIVESCTIPLTAEAAMTGTTREQTLVRLAEL